MSTQSDSSPAVISVVGAGSRRPRAAADARRRAGRRDAMRACRSIGTWLLAPPPPVHADAISAAAATSPNRRFERPVTVSSSFGAARWASPQGTLVSPLIRWQGGRWTVRTGGSFRRNGQRRDLRPASAVARAVAIRAGRIVAAGDEAEAARRRWARIPATFDLEGRTVVPGFIDAHNHFACTAETFFAVDARSASIGSIAELVVLSPRRASDAAGRLDPRLRHGLDAVRGGSAADPLGPRRGHPRASGRHPPRLGPLRARQLPGARRSRHDDAAADPAGGSFDVTTRAVRPGLLLDSATNLVLQTSVDICGHGPNIHTAIEIGGAGRDGRRGALGAIWRPA